MSTTARYCSVIDLECDSGADLVVKIARDGHLSVDDSGEWFQPDDWRSRKYRSDAAIEKGGYPRGFKNERMAELGEPPDFVVRFLARLSPGVKSEKFFARDPLRRE